ncbi:hypothetical protein D9M69_337930 [compost metagenome]
MIERPPALKSRFDLLMASLSARLPFRARSAGQEQGVLLLDQSAELQPPERNPWLEESASPPIDQPSNAPESEGAPKSAEGSVVINSIGPASLLDLINQSFEVMQTSLAQYKIAGYPPDLVINVPKRVCRFFEFYKAPELIELGRQIAHDTLEKFEQEN